MYRTRRNIVPGVAVRCGCRRAEQDVVGIELDLGHAAVDVVSCGAQGKAGWRGQHGVGRRGGQVRRWRLVGDDGDGARGGGHAKVVGGDGGQRVAAVGNVAPGKPKGGCRGAADEGRAVVVS